MPFHYDEKLTVAILSFSEPLQESTPIMEVSTNSLQPLSTSTRRGPNNKDNSETIPVATIIGAVCGGTAGIAVLVVLSVSAVCIAKKIQVHVHYDRRIKRSDSVGNRQNSLNSTTVQNSSNSTIVQTNMAYNQATSSNDRGPPHYQTTDERAGKSMQFNSAYGTQGEMQVDVMEPESIGDYERMSSYVAFRQGNQNQQEVEKTLPHLAVPMVYDMPLYQGRSSHQEDDAEHYYDYIK